MVSRKIRICPPESAHRSEVAWWIEAESKGNWVENGWYLLVDGRWRRRIGDGLHRYLRYEANIQQVLREGAGITNPLGVGTLLGSDTRRCLMCEDNTRYVPRKGTGVVDSLWSDGRRGAASCQATVAPSPPPARRVAGQTRVFLFRHGRKSSSSSPTPGEPTTVVVVVLRREQYHVVAAVEGHELETSEVEHRPGLKRLLKIVHLELNGKVSLTRSRPLPGAPTVGVSDPGDPQPD
jgi:hypothetical protein